MDVDAGYDAQIAGLLADLVGQAGTLATAAHRLLAPAADARTRLRARLADDGLIVSLPDVDGPPRSLCAVDGGSVREHLYAADLLVAVAAGAQGMSGVEPLPLGQRHWAQVREYTPDNDRLLQAAMASLELDLVTTLPHQVRILDGAFRTPLMSLSAALTATGPDTQQAAAALIDSAVLEAAGTLADPARWGEATIVALPKADAAHEFTAAYQVDYGVTVPGGDRFVAAQVLAPGEMLYPRVATEYATVHVAVPDQAVSTVQQAARALDAAVTPLRAAAQRRQVLVTYVKPATADTVIKVEFRVADPLPLTPDPTSAAVQVAAALARIVADETPGPFLQEPFAQYAADLAAKSVAVGAEALNQAMLANLPAGSEGYAMFLARSYRTKISRPSPGAPSSPPLPVPPAAAGW